ncbi:unnamed protein product [Peniophora sp. CBMAI 1063]|nr:unnamed protein product [Peniophora sp. CBMAI 1063]
MPILNPSYPKRAPSVFSESSTLTGVDDLWDEALEEYKRITGLDLRSLDDPLARRLGACTSNEDVLNALVETAAAVETYRKGGAMESSIRGALKHLVHGLSILLETGAEAASSLAIPGGKAPFVAVAVLLKAAKGVSAKLDDLEKLFVQFNIYLKRLNDRLRVPLEHHARAIAVEVLVEMLKALALATKVMRENRFKHFLKALFVEGSEARQAVQRLEDILTNEERTSITHIIVGMHALKEDLLDARQGVHRAVDDVQITVNYTSALVVDVRNELNTTNTQLADLTATIELLRMQITHTDAGPSAVVPSAKPDRSTTDLQMIGISLWTQFQRLLSGLNADDLEGSTSVPPDTFFGPTQWNQFIQPGLDLKIKMSILDRQLDGEVHCPWCHSYDACALEPPAYEAGSPKWPCESCGRRFHAVKEDANLLSPYRVVPKRDLPDRIRFGPVKRVTPGEQTGWPRMSDFRRIIVVAFKGESWEEDTRGPTPAHNKHEIQTDRDTQQVKVYELWGSRWIERGVGFCLSNKDITPRRQLAFTIHSLSDFTHVILHLPFSQGRQWKQSLDTVIFWDDKYGGHFALNFRYPEACSKTWKSILAKCTQPQRIEERGWGPNSHSNPV